MSNMQAYFFFNTNFDVRKTLKIPIRWCVKEQHKEHACKQTLLHLMCTFLRKCSRVEKNSSIIFAVLFPENPSEKNMCQYTFEFAKKKILAHLLKSFATVFLLKTFKFLHKVQILYRATFWFLHLKHNRLR